MWALSIIRQQGLLVIAYVATAAASIGLTRFDGGVAFLWGSAAILIAALLRTPIRRWHEPLLVCGGAGMILTGTLGLGWAAALPFALINTGEAALAAWLFRRWANPREPMQSLGWFFRFAAAVGIVAPLVAATAVGFVTFALGMDGIRSAVHFFTGHSLGNLTFAPLALLVTGRKARRQMAEALCRRCRDMAAVLILVVAVSVAVFSQTQMPLLFLPVLAVIIAAFRTGREGAAIAIAVLGVVGGGATIAGYGAIQLVTADLGGKLQFFQFYLAATVLTVLPVSADLQNRARILRKLRLSEERFRVLADHSTDILMHMNPDGQIRYVSPSIAQLGGHVPDQMVGRNGLDFIDAADLPLVRSAHERVLAGRGTVEIFRYRGLLASGARRWFETHSRALIDVEGRIEGVLSVSRDISAQVAREERLASAALTDSLTSLPNRRAFRSLAEARLIIDEHIGGDCVAVLDIDHFKQVNDRYGHGVGDEVLNGFAAVARRTLRQKDVVARMGGEEFAILFPDTSREQALQICERLREDVSNALLVPGHPRLRITVSGGVACLGSDGLDAALHEADAALYRAKAAGRDQLALAA